MRWNPDLIVAATARCPSSPTSPTSPTCAAASVRSGLPAARLGTARGVPRRTRQRRPRHDRTARRGERHRLPVRQHGQRRDGTAQWRIACGTASRVHRRLSADCVPCRSGLPGRPRSQGPATDCRVDHDPPVPVGQVLHGPRLRNQRAFSGHAAGTAPRRTVRAAPAPQPCERLRGTVCAHCPDRDDRPAADLRRAASAEDPHRVRRPGRPG